MDNAHEITLGQLIRLLETKAGVMMILAAFKTDDRRWLLVEDISDDTRHQYKASTINLGDVAELCPNAIDMTVGQKSNLQDGAWIMRLQ